MTGAADREEQAELRTLREASARSAARAGDTAAALVEKAGHPGRWLRGNLDTARQRVVREASRPPVLFGVPAGVILLAGALLLLRFRTRAGYGRSRK